MLMNSEITSICYSTLASNMTSIKTYTIAGKKTYVQNLTKMLMDRWVSIHNMKFLSNQVKNVSLK